MNKASLTYKQAFATSTQHYVCGWLHDQTVLLGERARSCRWTDGRLGNKQAWPPQVVTNKNEPASAEIKTQVVCPTPWIQTSLWVRHYLVT